MEPPPPINPKEIPIIRDAIYPKISMIINFIQILGNEMSRLAKITIDAVNESRMKILTRVMKQKEWT